MTLSHKQLHNLPVYTRSNAHLGYVTGFELDEMEQRMLRYTIKTHQGIAGLFDHELIIAANQVISLTAKKMIVDDLVIKSSVEAAELPAKGTLPAANTQ